MKKVWAAVLTAALMLSVTACGMDSQGTGGNEENNPLKATILTHEGETVTMTAEELIEVYDSNKAKFDKLYYEAPIQFAGTIRSIKTDTSVLRWPGRISAHYNKIVFEEGWCLILNEDTHYDLADLDVGDVVKVTTSIVGAPYDTETVQEVSDHERVMWLVGSDTKSPKIIFIEEIMDGIMHGDDDVETIIIKQVE